MDRKEGEMMSDESGLDQFFQRYRQSCPDVEPSVNFMPTLWEKIEARRSFPFTFRKLGRSLMTASAALCFLLLLLIGTCLPGVAQAQINPFRGARGSALNADDISALTDATNRLLNSQGLTASAKEAWSNPKSGTNGTVTAGNAVRQKGLACRVMVYDYTVPGPRAERNRRLTWCKTHDGWKMGS